MNTKKLIIGITGAIIAGALVVFGVYMLKGLSQPKKAAVPTNATIGVPIPLSETKTQDVEGIVTAISASSITVDGQSFSIVDTKDVQKVSGSSTTPAILSDITVGQKVLLAIDTKTQAAISIFILP